MATRTTTKKAEPKTTTAQKAIEKEAPAKLAAEPETKEPVKATVTEKKAVETEVKEPVKKTTRKRTTAKKTTEEKTTARKTAAKKAAEVNTEVFVQWLGKEIYAKDVVDSIKKIWTEEMGKKESELEDLRVYIKPEDNGAHYVINGDITGFLGL